MKFIVNSKYLAERIIEAVKIQANKIVCESGCLVFENEFTNKRVECHGSFKEQFRDPEEFDQIAWFRVHQYLSRKNVPEQPITVEFAYNKIDVYAVNTFEYIDN